MPRRNPKKMRGSLPSDPSASRLVERDDPNPTHRSNGARGESRERVRWQDLSAAERAAITAKYRQTG